MATVKSYTDLSQSKVLAKILPLESADMYYLSEESLVPKVIYNGMVFFNSEEEKLINSIYCWSLAALLSILPYKIKLSHDVIDAHGNPAYKNECYKFSINRCGLFGDEWNVQYYGKHERRLGKRYKDLYIDLLFSENYNNLVDACYEMILKLHEQKFL